LPAVPTMVEAGVPGYRFDAWGGLVAPAGTPEAIITRLHAAVVKVCAEPEYLAFAESQGGQVIVSASPQAFAKEIAETVVRERETVAKLGLKES
ncbi:MAG: tripartite tricarboxylate transporter substrate-binding protein, partial [Burkholderiaceae bacterium]